MKLRAAMLALAAAFVTAAQPVPSRWKGRATGEVHGRSFRLPMTIEIAGPLPFEQNPFNLSLSSDSATRDEASRLGSFLVRSAAEMFTPTGGKATLEYFRITRSDAEVTAVLRNTQAAAAAVMNTFVAPNVSAEQASELMRDVLKSLGPTEFHAFRPGAGIKLQFQGDAVTGTLGGPVSTSWPPGRRTCGTGARSKRGG